MSNSLSPSTDTISPPAAGLVRVPVRVGTSNPVAPTAAPALPTNERPHTGLGKPLSKRGVLMVITQLSIMTKSGVDIADAVRSISGRATDPQVRYALQTLYASLEEVRPLSKALADQGRTFDGVTIASVAAGEAAGNLSEVLSGLSSLMRDDLRTQSSIKSVLSYPIVLTTVTMGVLAGMIFFVLPQFRSIYENSPAPTPVVTQLLLDGATLLRTYWWALLGLAAMMIAGLVQLLRSSGGRQMVDRSCFQIPLLRNVCRSLISGRLFRLQGVLLQSGVPLLEVLQLTQEVSRNSAVVQMNQQMQQAVLVGNPMSSAMVDSPCIPDGAMEMIATAESNGQLAGVLQTIGEFYASEGQHQLKEVVKVAEPAIIVLLGVIVGGIVMAVMLPMLDLSTAGSM